MAPAPVAGRASSAPRQAIEDFPDPQPRDNRTLLIAGVAGAVALLGFALYWRLHIPAQGGVSEAPVMVRPLTTLLGAQTHPAFSPDGNTVAFSWNGPAEDNRDIYVQMIDGGEPLRLTTNPNFDTGPIFSPDGRRIAFSRFSGAIGGFNSATYVIPALGGREHKIADGWACTWSPDGKALVIALMEKGGRMLRLVSVDNGAVPLPTLVGGMGPTNTAPTGGVVRVSPDGRWLYATAEKSAIETQMYRSRLPGGNWEPIKVEGLKTIASYDVSPDGSEFLLMGRGQLHEPVRPFRGP